MSKRTFAALLAGIGLGILSAGVIILVWWSLSQRDRSLQIVNEAQRLEAALESAPFITLYEGDRPVTIIAPRSAYGLEQWVLDDAANLAEMGREVRLIIVPSGHGGGAEDATIAQLWLRPDKDLLMEWFTMRAEHWTGAGLERANGSSARMEALADSEAFKSTLMRTLARNGGDARWPVVVWRDRAGQMAVCLCNTPNAADQARHSLGLSQRIDSDILENRSAAEAWRNEDYDDDDHHDRHDYDDDYRSEDRRSAYRDERDTSVSDEGAYPRLTVPAERDRRGQIWDNDVDPAPRAVTPSPRLPGDVDQTRSGRPVPAARAPSPQQAPQAQPPRQNSPTRRAPQTEPPRAHKDAESLFY